jgi:type IV pilus assembly protein PilX
MTSNPVLYKSQTGVVLVISLIMLLMLSMIGITGMQTTGLEEKMAGNMRDSNIAFQAAESALVAGETVLAAAKPAISITCPGAPTGYYLPLDAGCDGGAPDNKPVWESINWSASANPLKTVEYPDTAGNFTGLSAKPRYIIELLPGTVCRDSGGTRVVVTPCTAPNATYKTYRITSRATGGTESAVVMLQSTYEVKS